MDIDKNKNLSRKRKRLILKSIKQTKKANGYEIRDNLCESLDKSYLEKNQDYILEDIDLETNVKVLEAIDEFFFSQFVSNNK